MSKRYKWLYLFLKLLELALWISPIITMEAKHARHCQSTISLWNDTITIEDPTQWANIWFGGAVLHFVCVVTLHSNTKKMSFSKLPSALKRQCYMLIFLSLMRVLVATNVGNICVYSLPMCSMLLVTCEKIIGLAQSSTHA